MKISLSTESYALYIHFLLKIIRKKLYDFLRYYGDLMNVMHLFASDSPRMWSSFGIHEIRLYYRRLGIFISFSHGREENQKLMEPYSSSFNVQSVSDIFFMLDLFGYKTKQVFPFRKILWKLYTLLAFALFRQIDSSHERSFCYAFHKKLFLWRFQY